MKNAHWLSEGQSWHLDIRWSYFEEWPHEVDCLFPVEVCTLELGQDAFLPSTTIFSVRPSHCCSSLGLNDTFGGRLLEEAQSDERGRTQDAPYIEMKAWIETKVVLLVQGFPQCSQRFKFMFIVEFHVHLNSNFVFKIILWQNPGFKSWLEPLELWSLFVFFFP